MGCRMSDKIGVLEMSSSGRWEIKYPDGDTPMQITSGDQFYIEVSGSGGMELTTMESRRGQYYSIDEHPLRAGLRASFVGNRFWQ